MNAKFKLEPKTKYVCLRNYYITDADEIFNVLEEFIIYDVVKRVMFYENDNGKSYNITWYDVIIDEEDRFISLKEDEAKEILIPFGLFREERIKSIFD